MSVLNQFFCLSEISQFVYIYYFLPCLFFSSSKNGGKNQMLFLWNQLALLWFHNDLMIMRENMHFQIFRCVIFFM